MASMKKCIENNCKACIYDSNAPGTWREQTSNCTIRTCPLWEVRPVTVAMTNARRKANNEVAVDMDALVAALPDEDEG